MAFKHAQDLVPKRVPDSLGCKIGHPIMFKIWCRREFLIHRVQNWASEIKLS